MEERARNTFDTTEDIDASNYVLTDGTGINLGEGDHRDIVAVFRKGIPPGYYNDAGSSSGYMLAFMGETGAMRTRTSSDGELHISLIRPITTEQARAIETTRATRITVDWLGKDYSTRASASFNPEYEMEDMIEAMRSEPRMRATQYGDIAPFYSALQRAVEAMPLKQAIPGDQMLNKIKGLPGVKAQEIEETGLVDYLAMQKEQGKNVTKAEVVEFLKQNGVRLESITKGALSHQNKIRLRHLQTNEIILNERERNELRTLERQAGIEGTGQWAEGGDTKFSEYAPPGGVPGSYREVLLTVPSSNAIPEGYYLRKEGDVWRFYTREGLNASGDFDSEDEARREFAKTFAKKNEGYTSPHWSEPNVIAHMLMDERRIPVEVLERTQPELAAKLRAEGKTEARALHMIEGQSDWIQRGTAEGFETKETKLQREQALQMRREQEAFNEKLRSEAEKKRIIAGRTVHFDWYDSDNVMVLSEDGAYWSQHHVQRNWGPNAILDKAIRDSEEYKTFVALQKQYRDPRGIVIPDSGIPPAPFKGDAWKRLVIRKMLSEAAKGGYDMLTWSTGADRAAKWGSERVEWKRTGTDRDLTDAERADVIASGGKVTRTGDQWTVAGTEQSGGEHAGMNLEQAARERGILLEQKGQTVRTKDDLRRIVEGILRSPEAGKVDKLTDRIWIRMQTEPEGTSMPRREFFEFLYDKSFVQEANDIIRKMDKGAKVAETQLALMGKDSDKWGLGDKLMPPVHAIVITPSLSSGISKGQPYYGELKGAPNEDVQRAERGSRTLSEVRETITRRLSRIQSRQENELPNDTRVRRKRKLDAWLSEVDGQDEYFRNIWSNARYDEALEKTPRFLDAERAFSKLGYDTVPITDLRGRGGMVHPGKRTVFIANTQEYIFYGFIAHEATHILAGQNNVDVAALVSAIDSNSHRFIEEHAKLPHLSVSEMKEELAAAIVSGRTDLLSVIEEGASPDLARKAQDAVIENVTGSPVRESAKASDAAYLAAVERGDLETAQRMVDEAAKKAGYNIGPMWHGTRTGMFTEFTSLPAWFTDSVDYARVYTGTDRIMLDSTSSTTGRGKRDDGRPETKRVFLQAKNLKQLSLPAEAIITEEDAKKILGDNVDIALPSLPTSSGENGRAVKLSGYGYFGREVEATLLPNGKLRVDREKPWHYTDGELEDVYLHLAEDEAPPAPPTEAQRRTLARMWLGIDSPIPNATTGASTQGWAFQGMSSPDELSALYGDGAHQEIVPTGPHRLYESVRDPLTTRVLKGAGYDGIEMEDQGTRTVGVFSASQIKSADAVTRDDAGRVIPLSERFNPKTPDIRYAELTPEEQRRRDRAANIRRIAGLPPIETPAEAEPEAKLNRAGRNKALARLREDIKVQKNRRETIINAARELLPLTKDQQRVLAVLRPTYRALGQTEMGMEAFLKAIDLIEEISEEMAVREAARKLTNIIPKPRDIAEMRPALRDKMTELLEGIDLTRMAGKTRESLKKMAAWLANPETNFEGIPQEALEKMQTRLGRLDKKAITDFSVEEIEAMTNMVKSYLHQQKLIEKLEEKQETREDYRIARQIAAEIMEKKPLPSVHLGAEREKSALGRFNLRTAELWNALRTRGGATQRTLARRMGPTMLKYFHENPYRGLSTTADIIHGQWASLKTALDRAGYKWGSKELQALSDIASGEDKAKTETITLEDGRKMQLTGAEIITLLAHGDQPYVVKQIANGTVGFMPRSAKLVRGRAPYRITLDDVNNIRRSYPKLYKAARAMIDVMAELKDDLNAKSVELYDYEMFREDDYFPILTSELYRRENAKGDDRSEDTMQAWFMATPENQAMMQERTGGSGVIVLDDAFGAFHKHAHGSGAFMGMQEHITKARTLLGIPEVKEAIASTYGMPTVREWKDRIKTWTLMAQPGETSTEVEGWWSRRLGDVVRAKLAFNPSPILKQVGGLFPLLSQLGETPGEQWRILSKYGLPNMFRPEWHQRTYKYAPLLRERNEMQAGTLVSVQGPGARAKPFLGREGVLNRLMRGMSWSDANNSVAAFASFWGKLKEQHPDWTDDQLGKAAGPLAEDAVGLTQNASNIMDATGIALQAKRSLALRLVTTFKSQQMAIYNTILDAGDKFQKSKHTAQDFATFAHTVVMSLGAASLYAAGVTTLLSSAKYAFLRLLLGKPDREDEKREGWLKRLVWTMLADAAATGNYLGSELIDAAHAFARFMESGRPMNLDVNNRNLLSDAIGNVFEAINKVTKAKDAADYAEVAADVALFAANVFGAPEYPIRLAKTAAQIAGEEYKGGLKKAKAPKPLKKIKPPKKVRQ